MLKTIINKINKNIKDYKKKIVDIQKKQQVSPVEKEEENAIKMLLSEELYNFLLEEYKINRTVKHYSTSELLHIMNSDNYDLLFSVLEKQNRDLLTSINYDTGLKSSSGDKKTITEALKLRDINNIGNNNLISINGRDNLVKFRQFY